MHILLLLKFVQLTTYYPTFTQLTFIILYTNYSQLYSQLYKLSNYLNSFMLLIINIDNILFIIVM